MPCWWWSLKTSGDNGSNTNREALNYCCYPLLLMPTTTLCSSSASDISCAIPLSESASEEEEISGLPSSPTRDLDIGVYSANTCGSKSLHTGTLVFLISRNLHGIPLHLFDCRVMKQTQSGNDGFRKIKSLQWKNQDLRMTYDMTQDHM